jgi:preprotein translocase subunit YajC
LGNYWLIIYVVAFIGIFYFMAIKPQQKQRRAHQALMSSLKKGDRVGTAAGIYGTVKRVEDNVVVVEIAKGVTIKLARRAVTEILSKDSNEGRAAALEGSSRRGKAADAETETEEVVDETQTDAGDGTESDDEAK